MITACAALILWVSAPYLVALLIVWPLAGWAACRQYMINRLMVSDTSLSVWFGGSSKEYASSRVGRYAVQGNWLALRAEAFIDWLMREPGHCRKYIEPQDHYEGREVLGD